MLSTSEIVKYFTLPGLDEDDGKVKLIEIQCESFLHDLIERYYYLHGSQFDQEKFEVIYQLVEKYIYADKLNFDVSIPILFVQFEIEEQYEIAPGILVRRIEDEVQTARHKITGYSPSVVDSVFMAATHEIVFKNYHINRPPHWMQRPFSHANFYRNLQVDKFFTILKVVTDFTSGYAQLLVHPYNWAEEYTADLKPITGAATKFYPAYFDDYY